jgi:hypothetical protein
MSPIDVIEVQVRAGPALLETATLSPDSVLVGRWEGTGGQAVGLWSGPFESASLRHQIQRLPPSLGKRVLDGAVVSFHATLTVWTDGTLVGSSVPLTTGDAPEVVSGARTLEVGGGPGTLRACVNGEMPERFEVCAMLAAPR